MLPGIYAACSGMCARLLRHDTVANNLANVSTPGFKASGVAFSAVAAVAAPRGTISGGSTGPGPVPVAGRGALPASRQSVVAPLQVPEVRRTFVRDVQGGLYETGNPLDLSLEGGGFMVVAAADPGKGPISGSPAEELLTRGGSFAVDEKGRLVHGGYGGHGAGRVLMGLEGPVTVDPAVPFTVDAGGRVFQGGTQVARLRLIPAAPVAAAGGLVPMGDACYAVRGGATGATAAAAAAAAGGAGEHDGGGIEVRQGFLETSNVDQVRELVEMIAALRAYETCQRVITSFDETLSKSVNDVGRV